MAPVYSSRTTTLTNAVLRVRPALKVPPSASAGTPVVLRYAVVEGSLNLGGDGQDGQVASLGVIAGQRFSPRAKILRPRVDLEV